MFPLRRCGLQHFILLVSRSLSVPEQAKAVVVDHLQHAKRLREAGLRVEVYFVTIGGTEELVRQAGVRAVTDGEVVVRSQDVVAVPARAAGELKELCVGDVDDEALEGRLDERQNWSQHGKQVILKHSVALEHLAVNRGVATGQSHCFGQRIVQGSREVDNLVFLHRVQGAGQAFSHGV